MQNANTERSTDRIEQLIEAAHAEERAKLAVETILADIHEKLEELEQAHQRTDRELQWVKGVTQSIYNNVATLVQLMAAIWQGDRSTLTRIQTRVADEAFKAHGDSNIKVDAQGDVKLSADKVGRDKRENDEGQKD